MPIRTFPRFAVRSLAHALFPAVLILAACESDSGALAPETAAANFLEEQAQMEAALPSVAPGTGLRDILDDGAENAAAYELDVLRIPAGTWDGYAQASGGAFLQCLVAWGPREARLALSVGWNGRLFLQFSAPGWSASTLAAGGQATIRVDDAAETTVNLAASGDVLWASLGTGPTFAEVLAGGRELVVVSGADRLVYPLERPDVAVTALYDCLDRETGDDAGDGAFAVYGVDLDDGARRELAESVSGLLRTRGFDDFVPVDPTTTADTHGRHAVLSGSAWQGQTEVFVTVFGVRPGAKKALAELADDAARVCRGEVAARLIRLDPTTATGESFGRSSLLCAGGEREFALETFAVFSGDEVIAIHAIVRDPGERERAEQSFEAMKATFVAAL